jgi:hypothetical protein
VQGYVKDHEDDGLRRWVVFSPDGEQALARATLPASLELMEIGNDWVLGVERDDLGVESMVLYHLLTTSEELPGVR